MQRGTYLRTEETRKKMSLNRVGSKYFKKNRVLKKCLFCNVDYSVNKYRNEHNLAKYCSYVCSRASTKGIVNQKLQEGYKEWAKTHPNPFLGKKHTPENLEKNRLKSLGKKNLYISGERNWNWKGGITPENEKIRGSIEYNTWRMNVFSRDNFVCQMPGCEVRGGQLQSHHIKVFRKFPELRFVIDNGITLCKSCHYKINHKEEKFEEMFNSIIKNKNDKSISL